MLERTEYIKLVEAMKTIGNMFYTPALGREYKEGKSYVWLDFIAEPDEIKQALQIVTSFVERLP